MLKWLGPGARKRSRPFSSVERCKLSVESRPSQLSTPDSQLLRGCDLTAEWRPATAQVRVRFPATAPTRRAPASAAGPPKPSGLGAAPRRRAAFFGFEFGILSFESDATACPPTRNSKLRTQIRFLGSWQTSNAPALHAGRCRSVTYRLHHPSLETVRRFQAQDGALRSALAKEGRPICGSKLRMAGRLPLLRSGQIRFSAGRMRFRRVS